MYGFTIIESCHSMFGAFFIIKQQILQEYPFAEYFRMTFNFDFRFTAGYPFKMCGSGPCPAILVFAGCDRLLQYSLSSFT
jgi:hypothetical protein